MALRRLLNVNQWTILGISYGTRLALEIARSDADGIEALILDSVDVPGSDLSFERIANLDQTLRRLDAACKADEKCKLLAPDLYSDVLDLATKLDVAPKTLRLTDPKNGGQLYFSMGGAEFLEVLVSALRTTYQTEWIPRAVSHAKRNRWRPFLSIAADAYYRSPETVYGTAASVNCQDIPEPQILAMLERAQTSPTPYRGYLKDISFWAEGYCEMWLPGLGVVDTAGPIETVIPTLILSGGLDPVTPERAARMLAASLPNAHLSVYPGFSHGVLPSQGCVARDVVHWLDQGALPIETACTPERQKLNFVTTR